MLQSYVAAVHNTKPVIMFILSLKTELLLYMFTSLAMIATKMVLFKSFVANFVLGQCNCIHGGMVHNVSGTLQTC